MTDLKIVLLGGVFTTYSVCKYDIPLECPSENMKNKYTRQPDYQHRAYIHSEI